MTVRTSSPHSSHITSRDRCVMALGLLLRCLLGLLFVVLSGCEAKPVAPVVAAGADGLTGQVTWQNVVGVEATGNSLRRATADGYWNAGASSVQGILAGRGYVEFTARETTTYRMTGLSVGDSNQSYDDIDFAINLTPVGAQVYQRGVALSGFVPYVGGDVFRIQVTADGTVQFLKNRVVIPTNARLVASQYPLLVDTSLYSAGATIENVILVDELGMWRNMVGVEASDNGRGLARVAAGDGWNAGAASVESFPGDCYVSFRATETTTYRMIGLSNGDSDQGYGDIDYALYPAAGGGLHIYESGAFVQSVGSYASSDILRVESRSGQIRYWRNSTLLRSRPGPGAGVLLGVDSAFYSHGATIENVTFVDELGNIAMWRNVLGVEASDDGRGLARVAAGDGWNAGAASVQSFPGDCYVSFRATETTTYRMIGLSNGDSDQGYGDIDYALYPAAGGGLHIYESGAFVQSVGSYASNDILRVESRSGQVRYLRNGVVLRERPGPGPGVWLGVDTSFYSGGATVADVVFESGVFRRTSPILGNVLHMTFNNQTATDLSGSGNHGSLRGARYVQSFPGNYHANFDGVDDYIEVPDRDLFVGAQGTIEAWIFRISDRTEQTIFGDLNQAASPITEYSLELNSDCGPPHCAPPAETGADLYVSGGCATGLQRAYAPNARVPYQRWTYVAVSWDGTNARFYINGALRDTVALASGACEIPNREFRVGRRTGGNLPFHGGLDDLKVSNYAKSGSDISRAMTYDGTGPACGDLLINGTEQCDGGGCCSASCTRPGPTTTCRASGGNCDPAEMCTAGSSLCPVDTRLAPSYVCRAAGGDCDIAETCNGATTCPPDAKQAAGHACREARGVCDLPEICDGSAVWCPVDRMRGPATLCRPRASGEVGACDVEEHCRGWEPSCPPDGFADANVECRPASGECDVTEACTGTGPACPTDVIAESGVQCRPSNDVCDVGEVCDGATTACPMDAPWTPGPECNGSIVISAPSWIRRGDSIEGTVRATSTLGDSLSVTLSSGPPGMTLESNGTLLWTPTPQDPMGSVLPSETHAVVFAATNGRVSTSTTWQLTVSGVIPQGVAVIGPSGGALEVTVPSSPIFGARLEVPPGALEASTQLWLGTLATPPPGAPPATLFSIQDPDAGFRIPATLSFPYDPRAVSDPADLRFDVYQPSVDGAPAWRPAVTSVNAAVSRLSMQTVLPLQAVGIPGAARGARSRTYNTTHFDIRFWIGDPANSPLIAGAYSHRGGSYDPSYPVYVQDLGHALEESYRRYFTLGYTVVHPQNLPYSIEIRSLPERHLGEAFCLLASWPSTWSVGIRNDLPSYLDLSATAAHELAHLVQCHHHNTGRRLAWVAESTAEYMSQQALGNSVAASYLVDPRFLENTPVSGGPGLHGRYNPFVMYAHHESREPGLHLPLRWYGPSSEIFAAETGIGTFEAVDDYLYRRLRALGYGTHLGPSLWLDFAAGYQYIRRNDWVMGIEQWLPNRPLSFAVSGDETERNRLALQSTVTWRRFVTLADGGVTTYFADLDPMWMRRPPGWEIERNLIVRVGAIRPRTDQVHGAAYQVSCAAGASERVLLEEFVVNSTHDVIVPLRDLRTCRHPITGTESIDKVVIALYNSEQNTQSETVFADLFFEPVVQVSVGDGYSCAVVEQEAYCWGPAGSHGAQLGSPATEADCGRDLEPWVRFELLGPGNQGPDAYCHPQPEVLDTWSDPGLACSRTPQRVVGGHRWKRVSVGSSHACAIDTDGHAWCWGGAGTAALGPNCPVTVDPQGVHGQVCMEPVLVSSTLRFATVAAGYRHTCGVTVDGVAYCWGDNNFGQLGVRTASSTGCAPAFYCPVPSAEPLPVIGHVRALRARPRTTCVLDQDGRSLCWGAAYEAGTTSVDNCWVGGSFGDCVRTPQLVEGVPLFDRLPEDSNCGITSAGEAWCWTGGVFQQDPTFRYADIAESCFIDTAGNTYCKGHNNVGQVGNGGWDGACGSPALPLTRISTAFRRIFSSGGNSCALDQGQRLHCWGINSHGQIGAPSGSCEVPMASDCFPPNYPFGGPVCNVGPEGLRVLQALADPANCARSYGPYGPPGGAIIMTCGRSSVNDMRCSGTPLRVRFP